MVVVEMSACPSSICTARKSAPWLSRWVAKAWRSVCGDSGVPMPAWRDALDQVQNITRDMAVPGVRPALVTNSASVWRAPSGSMKALGR
jgi:hypothetical protein